MLTRREFTERMLELDDLMAQVDALQAELANYVLANEASWVVGDISAKYVPPRRVYDWETAVMGSEDGARDAVVAENTITKVSVKWNAAAKELGITARDVAFELKGEPSVKFSRVAS